MYKTAYFISLSCSAKNPDEAELDEALQNVVSWSVVLGLAESVLTSEVS